MMLIQRGKDAIRRLSGRPFLFAVVLLGISIGAACITGRIVNVMGVQQMVDANDEYLSGSLKKSGVAFGSLSAVKAGVAVIEGSTVGVEAGVTADVQLGDAVQSIYDFIDMAWKITFFSSATLFLVRVILQQIAAFGPPVMMIAFVSGAVILAVRNRNRNAWMLSGIFRRVFRFFLLCTVGIYIALPLTVGAARFLSYKITQPAIAEGMQAFEDLQQETSSESMNERLFPPDEKLRDKLALTRKLRETGAWCSSLSLRLFDKGIRFCAGVLFDCLIFPGALVLTVWMILRKGLAGQGITDRTLRQDLEAVLRKLKREEPVGVSEAQGK
jgi:hypothetical protein